MFAVLSFILGVTSNLEIRVYQHKNNEGSVFTSLYKCNHLLYYENYQHIQSAIQREKQLKNWHRPWKVNLIKTINPEMIDLASDW
jgi:putative endonuclease